MRDVAKFVAESINLITEGRDTIRKGSSMLVKTINEIDELRIELLDDAVSSRCKQLAFYDYDVAQTKIDASAGPTPVRSRGSKSCDIIAPPARSHLT